MGDTLGYLAAFLAENIFVNQKDPYGWVLWHSPVIQATQEAEAGGPTSSVWMVQ